MARTSYSVRTRQCRLRVLHNVTVFERPLPSPHRAPCQGMTMTQQVLEAISFLSPPSRLSRSASCSHRVQMLARRGTQLTLPSSRLPSQSLWGLSLDEQWRTAWPWRWRHYSPSKRRQLIASQDASMKLKHCSEYVTLKYTKQYACLLFCVGVELGVSHWGGNTDLRGCWE